MKLISPNSYPHFHCIADRCRHSCCIGWEIDIDPATREKYRYVSGEFGQQLNAAIVDDGPLSCFRLGPDERCPMLNANGLCDLITALGEDALCQICADHPRFRNFFSDHNEIGLGLCCEEAARLVLTQEEPMHLIELGDDGRPGRPDNPDEEPDIEEEALLAIRDTLICELQDRARPLAERLAEVELLGGLRVPDRDWAAVYRSLERLDPAWDAALDSLGGERFPLSPELDTAFEQFGAYLLYRHLPGAMDDEDIPGRAAFCVLSVRLLMALCAAKRGCTMEDCIELARMYSAEVEYSEDNIEALLDELWVSDDLMRRCDGE